MSWFVLKHRRLEGPFEEEGLVKAVRDGRFSPADYAISKLDAEAGILKYVRLSEVRAHGSLRPLLIEAGLAPAPPPVKAIGDDFEPDLKNFEDAPEASNETSLTRPRAGEVTRIFAEALQSTDLVVSTSTEDSTPAVSARPASSVPVRPIGEVNGGEEKGFPFIVQIREFTGRRAVMAAVFIAIIVGALFQMQRKGTLPVISKKASSAPVPAPAPAASASTPRVPAGTVRTLGTVPSRAPKLPAVNSQNSRPDIAPSAPYEPTREEDDRPAPTVEVAPAPTENDEEEDAPSSKKRSRRTASDEDDTDAEDSDATGDAESGGG